MTQIDAAKGYTEDPGFTKPESVVEAKICSSSGKLARSGCPAITEYFADGTVPTDKCYSHYVEPTPTPEAETSANTGENTTTQANAATPQETTATNEAPQETTAAPQ